MHPPPDNEKGPSPLARQGALYKTKSGEKPNGHSKAYSRAFGKQVLAPASRGYPGLVSDYKGPYWGWWGGVRL